MKLDTKGINQNTVNNNSAIGLDEISQLTGAELTEEQQRKIQEEMQKRNHFERLQMIRLEFDTHKSVLEILGQLEFTKQEDKDKQEELTQEFSRNLMKMIANTLGLSY